jgi:hypothetical protein
MIYSLNLKHRTLATTMKEIHQNYIETFNTIAPESLIDYGYQCEVSTNGESTNILISNKDTPSYLLTFSTNRLDYDHGVLICESDNSKLNWDKIRLPNKHELNRGVIYQFMGNDLEAEIKRLISDFKNYINYKRQLGGEPFIYCSQSSKEPELSCNEENLKRLSHNKIIRENSAAYKHLNTEEEIYQCENCNNFWKKAFDIYSREVWLKVGENSDQKYFDRNQSDFKEKKLSSFPLTQFSLKEAIQYGLKIECGQFSNIDNYFGLSCSPSGLTHVKNLSTTEQVGYPIKVDIYKCSTCNKLYKIEEEYDSHKGTRFTCDTIDVIENDPLKKVANTVYSKQGKSWFKKLFGN